MPSHTKTKRVTVTIPNTFTPAFWRDADQRTAAVREIRRRVDALKTDTGCNSFQKEMLIERAIFLSIQLETMEREAFDEGKLDSGVYLAMTNTLNGLLRSLGLEPAGDKGVTLESYLEAAK